MLWRYFSPVKQGPRTIEMSAFRLDCFRFMIREVRPVLMGMVKGIAVLRQPG